MEIFKKGVKEVKGVKKEKKRKDVLFGIVCAEK